MKRIAWVVLAAAVVFGSAGAAKAQNFFRQMRVDSFVGSGIDMYHHGDYNGAALQIALAHHPPALV